MNLGNLAVRVYFLNSGNLICRSTDISMYFRESLGVRDNESRLYINKSEVVLKIIQIGLVNFAYM